MALEAGRSTGARVLVVDDNDDHRATVADILALEGYEVAGAGSAEEALRVIEAGPLPRVLVLDLLLPGEDGATLARTLRARLGAGAPRVVVVTGIASRELRRLLDVDAVLFKPVAPHDLIGAVGRAVARSDGGSS